MQILLREKLIKSKALEVEQDLHEADLLAEQGFYTSAFLRRWRVVEVMTRELMLLYQALKEAEKTGNKIVTAVKKRKPTSTEGLREQIIGLLYSTAKKRLETSVRNLDVGHVEKSLKAAGCNFDINSLKCLLATKLPENKSDYPGIKPIREIRNDFIHKNQSLTEQEYNQYLPYFEHYLSLLLNLKSGPNGIRNEH